jgi:hypothetical protein
MERNPAGSSPRTSGLFAIVPATAPVGGVPSKVATIGRKIEELLGDQVHHIPFLLNPAVDSPHAGAEHDPRKTFSETSTRKGQSSPHARNLGFNRRPMPRANRHRVHLLVAGSTDG